MRAIATSSWINAWSIYRACQLLGVPCYTLDKRPRLPLPFFGDSPVDFETDRLFFTDEASLARYIGTPETPTFYPPSLPDGFLDDKLTLATWLSSIGEKPVPYSLGLERHHAFPVLLKARHSWVRNRKLPRGWVCNDEKELVEAKHRIVVNGLDPSHFFLQRWLGDESANVLSVCGFFDVAKPQRNSMCVVERILSYTPGPSCSAAAAVVEDPAELLGRTTIILNKLQYSGPFELEYLDVGNGYFVLELNPRFWMQHGIFLSSGNGLVKRYLDVDKPSDWTTGPPSRILWIDGIWFLRRLAMLDFRLLKMLRRMFGQNRCQALFFPSLGVAAHYIIRIIAAKFKHI